MTKGHVDGANVRELDPRDDPPAFGRKLGLVCFQKRAVFDGILNAAIHCKFCHPKRIVELLKIAVPVHRRANVNIYEVCT